jgi:hypothetical protein
VVRLGYVNSLVQSLSTFRLLHQTQPASFPVPIDSARFANRLVSWLFHRQKPVSALFHMLSFIAVLGCVGVRT